MSSTLPALSSFSATPSSQAPSESHGGINFDSTSSILFTFLVIVLAFFGLCMLFGLCVYRVIGGRRRALRVQAEEWADAILAQGNDGNGQPIVWDVWTDTNEEKNDIYRKDMNVMKWKDVTVCTYS